jgi:hypothetical protein
MEKLYRLRDDAGSMPFLDYRYKDKEITFRLLKGIENEKKFHYLSTEHDVIVDWSSVCKEALSGEDKESTTPCWDGHYEQFGLVMLNLANMTRYKKTYDGKWNDYFEHIMPHDDLNEYIYKGYSGTGDRVYYRAWFALLGHPDFLKSSFIGYEALNYKTTELQLLISFTDINSNLINKKSI